MRLIFISTILIVLISASCGTTTLASGDRVEGEFPVPEHSLETLWPGAYEDLLQAGYPADGNWYADAYKLSGNGITGIAASSSGFTPVLVAIDGQGNLMACSDSWMGTDDAWIVLGSIPEGSRLLVFSLDDRKGDYVVESRNSSYEELDEFIAFTDLNSGTVFGSVPEGRIYIELENHLMTSLGAIIYVDDPQISRLHPFTLDASGVLTLKLESDDFDPVLVLAEYMDDVLVHITDNDDYDELNSRVSSWLDAGDYMVITLSYDFTGGNYTLDADFLPEDQLTFSTVEAASTGVEYAGEIRTGENLAVSLWPGMMEGDDYDTNLDFSDPTAIFVFTVDDPSFYTLTATSDIDICLTLLRVTEEGCEFVSFNDDAPDMGTNSSVTEILSIGEYMAVVNSYYDGDEASVSFVYDEESISVPSLQSGVNRNVHISYDEPDAMFCFNTESGWRYTISADNTDLDPMIEVYLPDGTVLFDDDGGGDLNSLLTFEPTEAQEGNSYIEVSTYWDDSEGTIILRLDRQWIR